MNSEILKVINSMSHSHDIIKDKGQRQYDEDRTFIFSGECFKYYAVMDGHGGSYVADHVVKFLENYFAPIKKNQPHEMLAISKSVKTLEEKDKEF